MEEKTACREPAEQTLERLNTVITQLRDNTEKAIYLNDMISNDAGDKEKVGLPVGDLPFMIMFDYLSKNDGCISALEEIADTIKQTLPKQGAKAE
jgi:hypothetical protein